MSHDATPPVTERAAARELWSAYEQLRSLGDSIASTTERKAGSGGQNQPKPLSTVLDCPFSRVILGFSERIVRTAPLQVASVSSRIAEFVYTTELARLPADILLIAKRHFLDVIGCCVAAIGLGTTAEIATLVQAEGGSGQASGTGLAERLPSSQAALLNGSLARALEYDDMAMPDLHPSGVIAPAAFAAAEWQGASGTDLLTAYALGLELCLRIGRAGYDATARSSGFLQRGQDASAICGAVAGAAVAARLLRLAPGAIANAIGISVSLASGSLESNRSGGSIKGLQSGWAASSAIRAAGLAHAGITGPAEAFEGRYGFYHCFLDGTFDRAMLADQLGTRWEMRSLRLKPYPSNYYTHAGIDAALALARSGLRPEQVEAAELAVATPMLRTMGEPLDRKQAPRSAYEAKFSGPYTVAAALVGGGGLGVGNDDFSDTLARDPARRALMHRISVKADPRCDAIFPEQAPAILTVRMTNGEQREERVMLNRGGRERPLDEGDLVKKFNDNVRRGLSTASADRLRGAIDVLPDTELSDIAALLRSAQAPRPSGI